MDIGFLGFGLLTYIFRLYILFQIMILANGFRKKTDSVYYAAKNDGQPAVQVRNLNLTISEKWEVKRKV